MTQSWQEIKGNAKVYERYMDDIIRDIKTVKIDNKLDEVNSYHENLTFTIERERNGRLSYLDAETRRSDNGIISTTWYTKPSDTGLIMNYHALAPNKYKRAVVSGFVHRIYRACSSWTLFHESLDKAKSILLQNQYPPVFFEKVIHETLTRIVQGNQHQSNEKDETEKPFLIFLQYRGKSTESYAKDIHKSGVECRVIFTLKKLKTVMPSLKEPVEKFQKSGLVYQIKCPRCSACYVGQTGRHLQVRFKEHLSRKGPIKDHMTKCEGRISEESVNILGITSKGYDHLLTLEALWIREINPELNTKDEFKSRELTIKL